MEPKLYEVYYVLKGGTEEELTNTIEQVRKYIEEKSGRSLEESRLIKRRLSYPIGKDSEGVFGSMKFFLKTDDLAELSEKLNREERLIRHMVTAVPAPGSESVRKAKKVKRVPEKKAADMQEIDKKLEEILGK